MQGGAGCASPCPSDLSSAAGMLEMAAAVTGMILGARLMLPGLVCSDADLWRGGPQCGPLDGI